MIIRKSTNSDLTAILKVNNKAFKSELKGKLVSEALSDITAKPVLSLVAEQDSKIIGHILFTKCTLKHSNKTSIYLLAPMSVLPEDQGKGVGGEMIKHGLKTLTSWEVDFVILLGHSNYYPKFGFKPAINQFTPPYPIPQEHSDAWMMYETKSGQGEGIRGQVTCANYIDKPEYWQ